MIKVAVMFGGRSVEHDVSIISAIQAINNFDQKKYKIYPIYISKNNEFYYSEELFKLKNFNKKEELIKCCTRVVFTKDTGKVEMLSFPWDGKKGNVITDLDVAFPIVHGTNVEDGILQGFLKTLDIPFVGCDVLSSAIGMDKYVMKVLLNSEGFPVLPGVRYSREKYPNAEIVAKLVMEKYQFPVIIKPVNLGSSVGISKADNKEELINAINNAYKYASKILIEHAISNLKEVNCSVLGNESNCIVSELEEPVTTHKILDFDEKYISGNNKNGSKGMASLKRKIPADINQETRSIIEKTAADVFQYLECCGVIRIDFMIDMDDNKVYLNEINTIPGSLAFYLWEPKGIKYSILLDKLVELAIERYKKEKEINYDFSSSILENMTTKNGTKV